MTVHRLGDFRDPDQATHLQVDSLFHHAYDRRERVKITTLRRDQWVCFEKRNDAARQIGQAPYREPVHRLPMIVMPVMSTDTAAAEELLQQVHDTCAPSSLDHREGRLGLPTGPTCAVPEDRNTEAALAVDEADDPLRGNWPFLLIVRTGRIFTFHAATVRNGCDMDEYRRMLGVSSI